MAFLSRLSWLFVFLLFDVAPSSIDIHSKVPSQKHYHSIHSQNSHEISLSPRSRVSCREHADELRSMHVYEEVEGRRKRDDA